ncbi:MAG: hypothetical protein LBL07_05735 [Tannerella sp.]|nr:hypothetical protein [Tannerella sp.]
MEEKLEEKVVEETAAGAEGETVGEKPRGRAAALASYRESNPEAGEDVADDDLFDFAAGRAADANGRYDELAGYNSRLAELMSKDPKFAEAMTMVAGKDGRSLPYSIAKVYGKDFLSMEGEALDDFEKGYQEKLAELANDESALEQANRNIEEYHRRVSDFVQSNGIGEDEAEGLRNAIYDYAIDILNGVIKPEFIDFIWKGMNYDRDVQEAADAGVVEGKNTVIKADMKKVSETAPVGGGTAGKAVAPRVKERRSFYDGFEEVRD